MTNFIVITPFIHIPDWELELSYVRSSGPGGQNVNKVNSKAVLRWNVGASPSVPDAAKQKIQTRLESRITQEGSIVITSDRFRDQFRNREDCIERLRQLLVSALHEPKARKKTKPTRASERRVRESKKRHSEKKKGRRPLKSSF